MRVLLRTCDCQIPAEYCQYEGREVAAHGSELKGEARMQNHFENANERYFVGSDRTAYMVNKGLFASFRISSSEFHQTCGAPWSDEAELDRVMLELIDCHTEITFREWCGFKYTYYVSPLNQGHQWRSSGGDGEWWWCRSVDSAEWTSSLGVVPYSTLREAIRGAFKGYVPPWLYEITEDEANGTGRQKMSKVSDKEERKFECTKCGRIGTVGRCCGRDTQEVV